MILLLQEFSQSFAGPGVCKTPWAATLVGIEGSGACVPRALVFFLLATVSGRKQRIRPGFRIVHQAIELKLEAAGFAEVVRLPWRGGHRLYTLNGMPPEGQDRF
jgi:hypothetical protein